MSIVFQTTRSAVVSEEGFKNCIKSSHIMCICLLKTVISNIKSKFVFLTVNTRKTVNFIFSAFFIIYFSFVPAKTCPRIKLSWRRRNTFSVSLFVVKSMFCYSFAIKMWKNHKFCKTVLDTFVFIFFIQHWLFHPKMICLHNFYSAYFSTIFWSATL